MGFFWHCGGFRVIWGVGSIQGCGMFPPKWRIQWKQMETEKATTSSGLRFRAAHEGDICRAEVPTCWSLVGSGGLMGIVDLICSPIRL